MFCPKCKTELPDDSQFCSECGRSLDPARKWRSLGLVGWIALAVVVIAGLVFMGVEWPSFGNSVQPPMSVQDISRVASRDVVLIHAFDSEGHERGVGIGFFVASDGTTVTNYDVIRGASRASAEFGSGISADVLGVIAYDPKRNIAIIRVAARPKPTVELGDSDEVKIGENLIVLGSAMDSQNALSEGVVNGMRNGVIQINNPIAPGSSGGPVFDSQGRVIGMATAAENSGFVVPIDWVKPYLSADDLRPLSAVAAENMVVDDLLDGSITVPASDSKNFTVTYDPNSMSDAEIQGHVTSTGGFGGKITISIYHQGQPIYQCRDTACDVHQAISAAGDYVVTIDNRESPMFSRTVSGNISMHYVK